MADFDLYKNSKTDSELPPNSIRIHPPNGYQLKKETVLETMTFGIEFQIPEACEDQVMTIGNREKPVLSVRRQQTGGVDEVMIHLQTRKNCYPVRFPTGLLNQDRNVSLVLRYTGNRLDLVLWGVLVHQFGVTEGNITVDSTDINICKDMDKSSLRCHLWDRALTDHEISNLYTDDNRGMIIENRDTLFAAACLVAKTARFRPLYHIVPESCWINDPNGLCCHNGKFHVFYQHNPYGPYWGTMHWGHVESEDFVHWKHRPVALEPEWSGPDRDGCFSGCCVILKGKPVIYYTAVYPETQCIAISDDNMIEWEKDFRNPLIPSPPYGDKTKGFRDPWVWKNDDGTWSMIIGSGHSERGGTLPYYTSSDAMVWKYQSDFIAATEPDGCWVYECPGFLKFADRDLLFYSPEGTGRAEAMVGKQNGNHFEKESVTLLDHGNNFYAPQATRDKHDRSILLGWIPPSANDDILFREQWAGCLSLPRLLTISESGQLVQEPLPELKSLRGNSLVDNFRNNNFSSDCFELVITLKQGSALQSFIDVLTNPDGSERTRISYCWKEQLLWIDRSQNSTSDNVGKDETRRVSIKPDKDSLDLHIFVDRSVVEVFVGGTVITTCVYPEHESSTGLEISSIDRDHDLSELAIWEMSAIHVEDYCSEWSESNESTGK